MATGKKKQRLDKEADISKWYHEIVEAPMLESPVDLRLEDAAEIELPPLTWHNFNVTPKKMKLTNTGYTIILSGKWSQQRPYLMGGPLIGAYVFSQLHLHWGANDMEGSEHSVDGRRCPMEMHAIFFRSCYLTQEAALKERDGVTVLVYFCQISKSPHPIVQRIKDSIGSLRKPFTYCRIEPVALQALIQPFQKDYLAYVGTLATENCIHYILWMACRRSTGLTSAQLAALRDLISVEDKPLQRNSRDPVKTKAKDKRVYHVCPSGPKKPTLLPL